MDTPSSSLPSTLLEWCVDIPNINPSDEADAAAWIDAWLGQVPVPTVSLSEIRSALGYRSLKHFKFAEQGYLEGEYFTATPEDLLSKVTTAIQASSPSSSIRNTFYAS